MLSSNTITSFSCFCTRDDQLLKKSRNITSLKVKVISPIDLILEIGK